jgi:spore coat protein U-like protein
MRRRRRNDSTPMKRPRVALYACAGIAMLAVFSLARAVQCAVATTSVAFGSYDPFANTATDGTGTVTVSCDVAATYTVAINAGTSGSFNRSLASGNHLLAYNLFVDATRTSVWGDGTAGTSRLSSSGTGAVHTVYARIPALQNVTAGSYADALTVTLEF